MAGVGDDGAVLRPPAGRELVTVIDTMVSGTHFPAAMKACDVGYRIVAVNLSDIAAMAAGKCVPETIVSITVTSSLPAGGRSTAPSSPTPATTNGEFECREK